MALWTLFDLQGLIHELHKAASETVVEGVGHSDSVNKSIRLEEAKKIPDVSPSRPTMPRSGYGAGEICEATSQI
ncbi:hypothetical protein PIB30_036240 [Stylosanthes scabra]|uniref:Uncharacterized protein n=1 Tax=Stylosanthes scabra TaxID=79078 RepID=A0ABU6WDB6_9FABA|nr:hypothetical protein [Stylosanthes scabra]